MNGTLSRILLILGIAWLAAVFDMGLSPLIQVSDAAPQACLLAAALAIVLSESSYAFLLAGGFGLAADLAGGGPLGACLAAYSLCGYGILRLRGTARPRTIARKATELLGGLILMSATPPLILLLIERDAGLAKSLFWEAAAVGLYTSAIALPVWWLIASTSRALREKFVVSRT